MILRAVRVVKRWMHSILKYIWSGDNFIAIGGPYSFWSVATRIRDRSWYSSVRLASSLALTTPSGKSCPCVPYTTLSRGVLHMKTVQGFRAYPSFLNRKLSFGNTNENSETIRNGNRKQPVRSLEGTPYGMSAWCSGHSRVSCQPI